MKKAFVAKNRKKGAIIKLLGLLFIVYVSLVVTFNLLLRHKVLDLLNGTNIETDLFEKGTNEKKILSFDLLNPRDMLKIGLNYYLDIKQTPKIDEVELLKNHVNDPEPRVYIYSTHDTETYDSSLLESYNIKYSVKIGSYILSEKLKNLGIPSYVEKESMGDYIKEHNLTYRNSYDASRYYANLRMTEYPSIEMIIDIHRDSVKASATRTIIDGKSYARVLFVVSADYDGYEKNMQLAEEMSAKLGEPLTRGILKKESPSRLNLYNQDIKDKAVLLEIGGVENTIEEVSNTLEVVAKAIFEVLNEG